jgi:aminoglycoside phosphotransferase (APT) family kinase protein
VLLSQSLEDASGQSKPPREHFVSAIIDFGDITSGDPATDLSVAWMLFPPSLHDEFFAAARNAHRSIDTNTRARAKGWALSLALAYLESSDDNPTMRRVGEQTLKAILSEV